ncbi:MAG: hypothetical protein ACYCZF_06135 [Anaerolineae bacterium]
MKASMRSFISGLIIVGLVLGVTGCRKASPDDAETQGLAKQFMQAVFVKHDSALAMSFVGPINTYTYVTQAMVDDIIATENKNRCTTPPESVQVGALPGDVTIPEITATDASKGITERTAWTVASVFECAGGVTGDRISIVLLEKVNGKWGVAKVTWQTGMGQNYWG